MTNIAPIEEMLCPYLNMFKDTGIQPASLEFLELESKDCKCCNGYDLDCGLYQEYVRINADKILRGGER